LESALFATDRRAAIAARFSAIGATVSCRKTPLKGVPPNDPL